MPPAHLRGLGHPGRIRPARLGADRPNPKAEARRRKATRSAGQEVTETVALGEFGALGPWVFEFPSDFGLRVSDFSPSGRVRRVPRRWCHGGDTEVCRCGSHVGSEIPCVCRAFVGLSAFGTPVSTFLAHSCPTQNCCPVSQPHWPRRGRLRRFSPAPMQASCCSSVSDALYFLEAAASRARQYRCFGVRGSCGLTQRRRPCLLPASGYHTQSPHRPLRIVVSRHFPEGAQNGQSGHRGLRGLADALAFQAPDGLVVRVFVIDRSSIVVTKWRPWHPVAPSAFQGTQG
jgi:hypothetical protein